MSGKKLSVAEQREKAKQWALEEEKKKRGRDEVVSPTVPKSKKAKISNTPPSQKLLQVLNSNKKRGSISPPSNNNRRSSRGGGVELEELDSPPNSRRNSIESSTNQAAARKRGRPSKASLQDDDSIESNTVQAAAPKRRGRPSKASLQDDDSVESNTDQAAVDPKRGRPSKASLQDDDSIESNTVQAAAPKRRGRPSKASLQESIQFQQEEIKTREDERINAILSSNQGKSKKSSTPEQPMNIITENFGSRTSFIAPKANDIIITSPVPQRTPLSERTPVISITKKSTQVTLEDKLQANFRETYNNAERQKSLSKSLAQVRKREGNSFYKKEKYAEAIDKYSAAIELDDSDISFYSNRSACHIALQMFEEAVEDGQKCLKLDKKYLKGYYRTGLGLIGLEKYDAALKVLQQGLQLDPANPELVQVVKDLKNHMSDTDEASIASLPIGKNHRPDISPNPYDNTPNQSRSPITSLDKSEFTSSVSFRIYSTIIGILKYLLYIPFSSIRNAVVTTIIIIGTYLFITFKKEIVFISYWLFMLLPLIIIYYFYNRFKTQSSEKVKATQQVIETIAELTKEQLSIANTNDGFYSVDHLKWNMKDVVNEAIQEKVIPMTPMNTVLKYNKDRNYPKKLIELLWKDIVKEVEKDPNIQPSTRDFEGKNTKCWRMSQYKRSPLKSPFTNAAANNSGMFSFFSRSFNKTKAEPVYQSPNNKTWVNYN